MANTVQVDRSVRPARITLAESFNVCGFFVDRHLAEGRVDKPVARGRAWTLSYRELHTGVCRTANVLRSLGIRLGDRVMLLARDGPAFFFGFLGAVRLGAVVIPTNTFLRAADYAYMLADSKAKVVLASDGTIEEVIPALSQPGVAVEHRIAVDTPRSGWLRLNDLVAAASPECPITPTAPNSACFWLYSSGSTGVPKASVHEHKDMIYTSELYAVGVLGLNDDDVIFSAPKLFFAYGLGNSLSFPLYAGCTAILLEDRPTAVNTLDMIQRFEPTLYFGVPTLYAAQVAAMEKGRHINMPHTRYCLSGGEPLPPAVMERWKRLTGTDVLDGIGSSEALHIYAQNQSGATKPGSAGRAVPGYRLRIINADDTDVPDGQPGELVVQGESLAKYYWNKPERTAAAWTKDGWFRSGDTMYRDADGFFFFCGRGDDMLKVGGMWVAPFEIESALAAHPAVVEVAVVGAPDENDLIKPKAYCVLRDGRDAGPDLERELIAFIKERLAPFKYPRWIEFVDELPKTASGKIQRFKLRAVNLTGAGTGGRRKSPVR
ncbi:MAG: benzoate-CoA ligase family protein [Proteobacteria bacterium]|nr:MAG: benzoate-CoA ligase family protein [Pseudomonadota bacterium]